MIEPKRLGNGEKLERGKEYRAEISFLVLEDVDSNAIYEAIAEAIVETGGARTGFIVKKD